MQEIWWNESRVCSGGRTGGEMRKERMKESREEEEEEEEDRVCAMMRQRDESIASNMWTSFL